MAPVFTGLVEESSVATTATMEEEPPPASLYSPKLPVRLELPSSLCTGKDKILVIGSVPSRARRGLEVSRVHPPGVRPATGDSEWRPPGQARGLSCQGWGGRGRHLEVG